MNQDPIPISAEVTHFFTTKLKDNTRAFSMNALQKFERNPIVKITRCVLMENKKTGARHYELAEADIPYQAMIAEARRVFLNETGV